MHKFRNHDNGICPIQRTFLLPDFLAGVWQKRVNNRKKFVRYKEGAEMYSMCQTKFEKMAKDAHAVYKLDKLVLVNCEIFEAYLETFRLED